MNACGIENFTMRDIVSPSKYNLVNCLSINHSHSLRAQSCYYNCLPLLLAVNRELATGRFGASSMLVSAE